MKILVDELPKEPRKCWFAKRNVEYGYICTFQHHVCNLEFEREECPCLKELKVEEEWTN